MFQYVSQDCPCLYYRYVGLAMGAPSSGLIAGIFVQHIEHTHLATGSANSLRNCSLCALHYLPCPIYLQTTDLHLPNPQTPHTKVKVEYRIPSGLAPIHATIPPKYANAGHYQKKPTSAETAHPLETLLCYKIA